MDLDMRPILVLVDHEGAPIPDFYEDYDTALLRPSLQQLMLAKGYGGHMTIEVYVGDGGDQRRISAEMRDKLQEEDGIFFIDIETPGVSQIADTYIKTRMNDLIFSRRWALLVVAAADGGYVDYLRDVPRNPFLDVYLLFSKKQSTAERIMTFEGAVGRSGWLDLFEAGDSSADDGTKKKSHINIVVIGHLKSGKSTTAAHLIYKLGGIDQSVIESVEKEAVERNKSSFKYAWVLDKLNAERKRGITIETSLWKFETIKYDCTVIDTPGHPDFIRNMISGASNAACAVLIIDSSKAYSEAFASSCIDAQTCDHALLAYTLGVKQIICCLNKMDATTPPYSEARYMEISQIVSTYLISVGFKSDKTLFVPISGFEGDNLTERSTNLDWYQGPTLREAIDQIRKPRSPSGKPLRLPLQHVYNIDDIGTVPVGRVVSGILKPGMFVTFGPSGLTAEVKSVESHHQSIVEALPGDNVGFHVMNGVDLKRGYVASNSEDDPAKGATNFISQVTIIRQSGMIRRGYTPTLYCHTTHGPVRFSAILSKIDRRSGKLIESDPEFLEYGDVGLVEMTPTKPMVVETNSKYPPLGRFALMDKGKIVAVGVIRSVNTKAAVKKDSEEMAAEEGQVIDCHTFDELAAQLVKAKESNKLIVIDFTASWCPLCRVIAPIFADYAKEFMSSAIFFKVDVEELQMDVDELQSVAKEFGMEAMPTFVFIKAGEIVDKVIGARKEDLHATIVKHTGVATA